MLSLIKDEIIQGKPRQMAENLKSGFGPIIAKALRRYIKSRTYKALDFWREIKSAKPKTVR